jgi:hypothetical protein
VKELTCNEISVNTSRQKALINHFIREIFGNEGVRADVKKYQPAEYLRVLTTFTAFNCSSLPDSAIKAGETFGEDLDILLSFLKHYALQALSNSEIVPIKDHLANHLSISAMLKVAFMDHPEHFFGHD